MVPNSIKINVLSRAVGQLIIHQRKGQYALENAASSSADNFPDCRTYRLFLRNKGSKVRFLMNSSVDVSILLLSTQDKQFLDYKLYAANVTEFKTYVIKMLTLDLGFGQEFHFPFIVSKINKGIWELIF